MSGVDMNPAAHRELDHVESSDGWKIRVELALDPASAIGRGALLVPASKHERDGWGPAMAEDLIDRGFVVLSTDIRGRGDSREPQALYSLPPGHLARVRDDVAAAVERLSSEDGLESGSIVLFGEQDTADAVASVAIGDERVGALVLVSPKISRRTLDLWRVSTSRSIPVCLLVCKDDGAGLVHSIEMFRLARHPGSRIRLVADVGSGTTMFAAWQHSHSDEPSLERWLGAWAAAVD